jgi:hypothetical protein
VERLRRVGGEKKSTLAPYIVGMVSCVGLGTVDEESHMARLGHCTAQKYIKGIHLKCLLDV